MGDAFAEALIDNLGLELTADVVEEFRTGRLMASVQAKREQAEMAAHLGVRRRLPFGEVRMQIHPYYYHAFGLRYGYECWDDPEFVRDTLAKNPECRVRSEARGVSVSMAGDSGRIVPGRGGLATGARRRFHKRYGEL